MPKRPVARIEEQGPPPRPLDAAAQGDDADSTARCGRRRSPTTSARRSTRRTSGSSSRPRESAASRSTTSCSRGPPGLGKTTLALHPRARDGRRSSSTTSGPVIEHKGALAALLTTKLQRNDILFIDEIHRLNPVVEESLYPAIDDSVIDIMTGEGAFASAVQIPLQPFTLVGATTRTGLAHRAAASRASGTSSASTSTRPRTWPSIVLRSAQAPRRSPSTGDAAREIAARSRGTPRIANRLLRRVRDFAEVLGTGRVDLKRVRATRASGSRSTRPASTRWTDATSAVIIDHYDGGPVGVDALAAALAEPRDTLEDVVEPFLIQQGYVGRTPRGRIANRKAYEALGSQAASARARASVGACPRRRTSSSRRAAHPLTG